ncbi:MAG: hypothetical protein EOO77_18275 [Oxalobacteraceae bacterium]|nr:MAG: hypothetical protein EOO77_18275 [Oxalobacteraceae bacterium]
MAYRLVYHPTAYAEAQSLIIKYDGGAADVVKRGIDEHLARGDVDAALHLDQVRRAVCNFEAS